MSVLKFIVVAVSVACVTTAALAFQEQQPGPAAPAAAEPAKPVDLGPAAIANPSLAGTEVRIPGLVKLGNLPKMDFGLELLYGATEPRQPENRPRDDARDDLTLRGSVKHKF